MRSPVRSVIALTVALMLAAASAPAIASRAVSMRVLQSRIRAGRPGDAATLCGLTRVSGYVVDPKGKDIILIGESEPGQPALHVGDLVVAIRNINLAYARTSGNVRYYSPPGCSIDPDPRVMQQVQQMLTVLTALRGVEERKAGIAQFESIARQSQSVRVLGVPANTRFASVMVDADYYMKKLTDGSESLGIDGFESVMDMRMHLWESNPDRAPTDSFSVSRFWFSPGDSTYTDDGETVMLKDCRVQLLTEEEFVKSSGERVGTGIPDPLAQAFTLNFTAHFQEIAAARPIYRELEGLYRFVALARLLKERKSASTAGLDLGYLTGEYGVPRIPVTSTVSGLARVQEMSIERTNDRGDRMIYYKWLMCCGGVRIDPHPTRLTGQPETKTPGKPSLGQCVLSARASKDTLYWDYTLPSAAPK